ncbi:MAG TPA: amidase [Dehalococcoidia bacterium]|nr:amidase [Dehalococcoidia bacterium]
MIPLTFAPATELARAVREREVSSAAVIEAHLARIAAINPQINAVVQLPAEEARAAARTADAALARGEQPGPLHGVPFTVKDTLDVAGVIGAMGVAERAGFIPDRDATVVARLRAAGGIVLGKTNVPPWGGGIETDNPVYGRTSNPYNLSRTPGGSSGGEAALIAAGGSPLGLGSDSGGSLRLPAHNCGIVTIKPTAGRVPTTTGGQTGDMHDPRTQVGLLARRVEDLCLALPLIAGPDGFDAGVAPVPLLDAAGVDLAVLRVACFTNDGVSEAAAAVAAAVRAAAQSLRACVAALEEQRPEGIERAWPITQGYWESVIDGRMPTADFYRLLRRWGRFRSTMLQFMQRWDAIVCPVAAVPAVPHGTSKNWTANDFRQASMISYTVPYSLTGWPCVVVRAGASPEGLPIGVQIVARPWREEVALALARQVEAALGGWQPPPL